MTELKIIAQKCSCNSVWCESCFVQKHAPKHMEQLRGFDWQKTRQIVLTVNPLHFKDGQEAYEHITSKKLIHNLIRNIERGKKVQNPKTLKWDYLYKPIKIYQYKWFLEWYENGFPHLHLFVETEFKGRAGMIGGDRIRHYWNIAKMIYEKPVMSKAHWKRLTGYFNKNGYFSKGKKHQIKLPSWAIDVPGLKIRRCGSKVVKKKDEKPKYKLPYPLIKDNGCIIDKTTGEIKHISSRKPSKPTTYRARFKKCGSKTRIKLINSNTYIFGQFDIPYSEIRKLPLGTFEKGVGYCFSLPESDVLALLDKLDNVFECSFSSQDIEAIEQKMEKWKKYHLKNGGVHEYYRYYN